MCFVDLILLATHEVQGGVHGAQLDLTAVAWEDDTPRPDSGRGSIPNKDRADRVGLGTATGSGITSHRDGVIRAELLDGTGSHGRRAFRGDSAVLSNQALGDAEQVDLGVVGVADGRTGEDLGGSGDVGKRIGEQAAGAGLGEGHGLLEAAQLLDHEGSEAGVAGADEVVADGIAHLAGDLTEFFGGEAAAGGRDACVDHAGVRAKRKYHARLEERADDRFERHGADTEGADLHVGFALTGTTDITETRHNFLFEHRAKFERRTGQHHERLAITMIEDAGRGTARIGESIGTGRDEALAEVGFGNFAADEFESLAQGLLSGRDMLEFQTQRRGNGRAHVVVGGRTDATGGDDEVIGAPGFTDLAGDFHGVVANHNRARNRQAAAGELLTQPQEVPILANTIQ